MELGRGEVQVSPSGGLEQSELSTSPCPAQGIPFPTSMQHGQSLNNNNKLLVFPGRGFHRLPRWC